MTILIEDGRIGFICFDTFFMALLLFMTVILINYLLEEKFRLDVIEIKQTVLGMNVLTFIIILALRIVFELFIIETNSDVVLAIFSLIYFFILIRWMRKSMLVDMDEGIKIDELFIKPLIAITIVFWVIALLSLSIIFFNLYVFDEFTYGLWWTGITELFCISISVILNKVLPLPNQIPQKVNRNTIIGSVIVSSGIWIFQLLLFGLFGLFSNNYFFLDMTMYLILIALYFISFYLLYKLKFAPKARSENEAYFEKWNKIQEEKKKLAEIKKERDVILEVKDLVTHFYTEEGIVRAVEGVSFEIYKNEVLGLVGETGCGKSVSALSILRLVRPPGKIVSGEIIFEGENLLEKSEDEILNYRGNEITMIFQDPLNSINPVYKVGNQIVEVYLLHKNEELQAEVRKYAPIIKEAKLELDEFKKNSKELNLSEEIIAENLQKLKEMQEKYNILRNYRSIFSVAREWSLELLKNVGIPDPRQILDRYPHELSGGMRQRVMIAMGLACSPKLLLADEPTTALDVTIQAQILKLMRELKQKFDNSILFITHDLGIISKMCDRVAVMYSGKVIEYGNVSKLFKNPCHPYTKGLISAIPIVGKRTDTLTIIRGTVPNLIYPPEGCRFHPRCEMCFEPCSKIIPKRIEVEPNYYVACHLYDPIFQDQIPLRNEKENIL